MFRIRLPRLLALILLLLSASCGGGAASPGALRAPTGAGAPGTQPLSTPVWYVIADAGGGGGGNDRLFSVDITLPVPQNAQTAIGAGTGTNNIEGAAFWPGSDTLYAFDSDRLGTVDLATGVWTQVVNRDVWDDGNPANLVGLDANRNPQSLAPTVLGDIDSVAFDPNTGVAYGVGRLSGPDILFVFDTTTGRLVRGAFQIGAATYDFFRVAAVEPGNEDIDDIAIDPYDGQLYGIANGGGNADRLVRIDKHTGVATDVGPLGVFDMEGFAFFNDSTMWGVTGSASNTAGDGSSNSNAVFSLNRVTGEAYDRRPLTAGGSDFESMAFLTADLNEFCGRVWTDTDADGSQDPGEPGAPGVTVVLWRDVDDNDVLDADRDVALVTTVTDASGDYCFGVASTGDYVITIAPQTLPPDFVLSHPNVQAVSVVGFGNTVTGLDFVAVGAVGTLGDTVFLDVDGDGVQAPTEPGLRDVTVNLYLPGPDGVCGTGDDVFAGTATTDGGGYFLFSGLGDGAWCLDVDESALPASSALTTGNEPYGATIVAGSNDPGADFGYVFPAGIGDLVWLDVDGDGVVDPGEPGLAGIDLTLRAAGPDGFLGTADDSVLATTTSAADGSYAFAGLAPGSYSVTLDAADIPAGAVLTTFANPLRATVRRGQDWREADFGLVGDASIGDRVWNDVDGDGLQDAGEPGYGGVIVTLVEAGPDGTLGTADDLPFAPQVTDASGAYLFPGLIGGLFRVDVAAGTLPAGVGTHTTGNDPLDVPLASGTAYLVADFGYKLDDASIGDRLWSDLDGDGVEDAGEGGLVGVTVRLLQAGPDDAFGTADDVLVASQATTASGAYDFTALPAGTYRVDVDEATLPAGMQLTTANEPQEVILAASQDENGIDFGYWIAAAVGDRIWEDLDGDGVQDGGEPGLPGVTVDLFEAGADATLGTLDDTFVASDTTLADGSYGFGNLPAGLYRVDVREATVPVGYTTTTGNDPLDVALTAGDDVRAADFGYWAPSSIGDRIWNDLDGNGAQDAGEPGLLGIGLTLTEAGPDGLLGTADDVAWPGTSTAADGSYAFGSLPPGLYRVDVVDGSLPPGYAGTSGNDPLDIALPTATARGDADFGYWQAAFLGDRVWEDLDGDGMQDVGESGIVGVTVALVEAGPDGLLGTADDVGLGTQVTGADGAYSFSALAPGRYRIDVLDGTVPAGMAATTADPRDVTLAPGDALTTLDFGFRHAGRIGDLVWDDLDGDGVRDAGEPGLDGVTVLLGSRGPDGVCGTADDVAQASASTAGGGLFAFEGLPPGDWCVLVDGSTLPPGYVATTGSGPRHVVLAPGQDFGGADFGFQRRGAIGDRVWLDVDADGLQDAGEPGIAGVRVTLQGAGPDGTFGTADDASYPPEVTAADGSYLFDSVPAGLHRVGVDGGSLPAGLTLTTANEPLDLTLGAGEGYGLADFGYQYDGAIGDRIWEDLDGDGAQDAGEPGLVGVTVELLEAGADGVFGTADDVVHPPAVSGANGVYGFANLRPGRYRVSVAGGSVPAGAVLTSAGEPLDVMLAPSQVLTDADFGYRRTGALGDRIWQDLDGDGVQDAGEPGLVGVTVRLLEAGVDGVLGTADDVAFPAQVSGADGAYAFADLPAGSYRVLVDGGTLPAGMVVTTANQPLDVVLAAAQVVADADIGYRLAGSVGDRIWQDLDFDGLQDPGEPGLVGVTVDLFAAGPDSALGTADDVPVGSRVTGADGIYGFDGLAPGLYRVTVAAGVPAGMVSTTANDPLDVALAPAEARVDADFGYQFQGSIGDRVWNDADEDGVEDVGEAGLDGVTLDLVEAGPDGTFGTPDDVAVATATTAGGGRYDFTGLPAGLYRVDVREATLPPSLSLTGGTEPYVITLAGGQDADDADFGYALVLYEIGDVIWVDSDSDGAYEPVMGERPVAGVLVVLRDAGGTVVATDTTSAAGEYRFQVPPGTYEVEVDPLNFQPGGPLEGLSSTGAGTTVAASISADNYDLDFGFLGQGPGTRQFCDWWASNTAQWPLQALVIGGTTYSQAQTLELLERGNLLRASLYGRSAARTAVQADMTVLVAWALIGAKLNVGAGNGSAAIEPTLVAADAWLQATGLGAGVRSGDSRFAEGRRLYDTLSAWNLGR